MLRQVPTAYKWLVLAFVLLGLFLIFTVVFSTGVLLNLTLVQEQWLLHRPLTGIDCVFYEWKRLGDVTFSLVFTLLLSIACLWLRYRRRVLPYLLLLFLLAVGIEGVGKQLFAQPLPPSLGVGMSSLSCPQIRQEPLSIQLSVMFGMWWQAPSISQRRVRLEEYSATTVFTFEDAYLLHGYPSGHTIRWSFIGLIACWLVWRHAKRYVLRIFLMALALAITFGGGFMQFYIGAHLMPDLIAGLLVGACGACCIICLLLLNETRKGNDLVNKR